MTYDQTFPKYAGRMIRWLLGLGVAGAVVLFFIWGWRVGGAWILGAFFHAAFFLATGIVGGAGTYVQKSDH